MRYRVKIRETLERTVEVSAKNEKEAVRKTETLYDKCSIVLNAEDFEEVTFTIQ